MNNIVVIASTAGFLVDSLRDKLRDFDFRTIVANNDSELKQRINTVYPRYIFLEHCFMKNCTDEYLQKIIKSNHNLHVVIWTASEIAPVTAARFFHAGAESYFSLRETGDKIDNIFKLFLFGKTYCPSDIEGIINTEISLPIIGAPLTDKEIQIMKLIDKSDKEIAETLRITINTLYFHKKNIYKKLGKNRKQELVSEAIRMKIIPAEILL
jgi:DNA-binding NarL/FixJ family response regulator